jgi:hypothetical protein
MDALLGSLQGWRIVKFIFVMGVKHNTFDA